MTSPAAAPDLLRERVPALDGVRGLAMAMVLAFYFLGNAVSTTTAARAIVKASALGIYGVDLFFVLSGFLLTGILLERRQRPGQLRSFWLGRVLRIVPLYVMTVAAVIAVPLLAGLHSSNLEEIHAHQGWLWLFGVGLFNALHGAWSLSYVDHLWAVAVGVHFFLVWPLVVAGLGNRPRALLSTSLLVALASRLALGIAGSLGAGEFWAMFTPFRLDGLALGSFLAVLVRQPAGRERVVRGIPRVAAGATGLMAASVAWHRFTELGQPALQPLRSFLLVVLLACLVAWAFTARPGTLAARFFASRPLAFLGTYSYGLYVFHHFIAYYFTIHRTELVVAAWVGSPLLALLALAAAGTAASAAIAFASYHLFEKRFLALQPRAGQNTSPAVMPAR